MMNDKKIKGVLFDFNGTLFFDSELHIKAFKKYFTEHGKDEPSAEFITQKIFGRPNPRIYSDNFNPNPTEEEWREFADEKEGLYRDFCLSSPELMKYTDGATELLDYLKENDIPYCLATGCGIDNVSFYMEHMDLGRWFDLDKNVVYFDGTFAGKPEPDTYLIAAEKLGLEASECLVFEDGTSGILAANRANAGGVVCVYERSLPSPITDEIHCDSIHYDFTDWKKIIEDYGLLR
jgi:beta-phosphoglucomutase-like phosphatase (HAD superfamily)